MKIIVGLGSNLGAREQFLRTAIHALQNIKGIFVHSISSLYETLPIGGPPQPNYLNAAVLLDCVESYTPEQIVTTLLKIESSLGRQRNERFGPRTIDLDLLWADCAAVSNDIVTVPHPRLCERMFALLPLIEVWPVARHTNGQLYKDIATTAISNTKDRGYIRISKFTFD